MQVLSIENFDKNKESLSKKVGPLYIDSVFIEKDGVLNKNFYVRENLHELRSGSKLLVAFAVGIAIAQQKLINNEKFSLDSKVYPILKELVDISDSVNLAKIKQWTLRNLLTHSTGYEKQMMSERFIVDIDKNKLLDYALNYEIPNKVGSTYTYNNVEPYIISVVFQEAFGVNLTEFINNYIFNKLDIKEYKWENYGKYCPGASGLLLKHSDFHKLGQLILNDGKYKNKQVVPKDWIKEMTVKQIETPSLYKAERLLPKLGAGYFTFISRDGYVFRDGSDGQYLIINRQKNLIISILSSEPNMKYVSEVLRGLI